MPGIRDVVVTAVPGQFFEPLPEGHSYLGFIFAEAALPEDVARRLRDAHRLLRFAFDRDLVDTGAYFDRGGT